MQEHVTTDGRRERYVAVGSWRAGAGEPGRAGTGLRPADVDDVCEVVGWPSENRYVVGRSTTMWNSQDASWVRDTRAS